MSFHEGFLSEIIGRPVVVVRDGARTRIGRVLDLVVERPQDTFPKVDAVVVKTPRGAKLAPMASVGDIESDGTVVVTVEPQADAPPDDEALYLVEDLFDKQIVDVDGRKVVRINDLEIARTGEQLRVVAADIGASGLLRRLGVARLAPGIFAHVPRSLIAWDTVAPLHDFNPAQIALTVSEHRLARLHPSDLAAIISELGTQDAARVVGSLDDETAADALEHLDAETQQAILADLGTERAADIVEEMDADDAADLLGELDEERQRELLAAMEPETADDLRELVAYHEDTAGGMMTTDYVWIYPHRTVGATIEKLREIAPETEFIYYLYVTDQSETLLGVLSLRTLLLSTPDATIHSVMDTEVVTLRADASSEDVAATVARYDLMAVPVVDEHGRIQGIVTVDDAIDAILPERLKDRVPRFTTHHRKRRRTESIS